MPAPQESDDVHFLQYEHFINAKARKLEDLELDIFRTHEDLQNADI